MEYRLNEDKNIVYLDNDDVHRNKLYHFFNGTLDCICEISKKEDKIPLKIMFHWITAKSLAKKEFAYNTDEYWARVVEIYKSLGNKKTYEVCKI